MRGWKRNHLFALTQSFIKAFRTNLQRMQKWAKIYRLKYKSSLFQEMGNIKFLYYCYE